MIDGKEFFLVQNSEDSSLYLHPYKEGEFVWGKGVVGAVAFVEELASQIANSPSCVPKGEIVSMSTLGYDKGTNVLDN